MQLLLFQGALWFHHSAPMRAKCSRRRGEEVTEDFSFFLASGTEGHAARAERQSTSGASLASEHGPVWAVEPTDGQTGPPTLRGTLFPCGWTR